MPSAKLKIYRVLPLLSQGINPYELRATFKRLLKRLLGVFMFFMYKKALYNAKDIKLLNNFDIDRYIVLDVEDKDDILNDICDLIDEQGLANIRELRRFVKTHGTEYNLPSMKILNSVLRSHTGLLRLYFDAVYQERRYGRSDFDAETGEIK